MSTNENEVRFACSYCEQVFKITDEQVGKRVKCPKCRRTVWVYPNLDASIDSELATRWYYKKLKLLRGHDVIGPLTAENFLALYADKTFYIDTEVSSPEFTGGKWLEPQQIDLSLVRARVDQRVAERQRQLRVEDRRKKVHAANRQRLRRAVFEAVSDGRVTLSERSQLLAFTKNAGIPEEEVASLLENESKQLLDSVIADALEDGLLEPHEKERIGQLANGLGLDIELTDEQNTQLHLCELAFRIASGSFSPDTSVGANVQLTARETPLYHAPFEWFDIVQLKRPAGIPLGGDHYLKLITSGNCLLTDKRVILVGDLSSKKFTLSSVAQARRYADGVLFNRSSGKSVFLRPLRSSIKCEEWAMLAIHAVTGDPVLGTKPARHFVPADDNALSPPQVNAGQRTGEDCAEEPCYTFRVVGDHIGRRREFVAQLAIGTPVRFSREPENPYDTNAVAVYDEGGNQLGYLKRDVAAWFGPMIDRGRSFTCRTYRKPPSGGLLVGMYESK